MLYTIAKSLLLFGVAGALFAVFAIYKADLPIGLIHYFLFPAIVVLINYTFIQFALGLVQYYNKLFLIAKDRFIIIENTLILKEDTEMMDLSKIVKIDVECHGLIPNMLNFGNLIIEQQKNEVRTIHFVPDPYHVLRIIREKTNYGSTSMASQPTSDIAFFKL